MGLISLPDPISIYESAKNAGLEREAAEDVMGWLVSDYLATKWGWRNVPIIGAGLGSGAYAAYVSLKNGKLFAEGRLRITVPKTMKNPDLLSQYETEFVDKH